MKMAVCIRLAVLIGITLMRIQCIEITHWGNYFVFTFLHCGDTGLDVDNIIVVTTREVSSNISIISMETNETLDVSLAPFTEYKHHFNSSVTAIPFGEILPRKAVVVVASTKISVYGFCANSSSVDGFLVIPVAGLGYEYRTVSPVAAAVNPTFNYGGPQFAAVAVEDETELNITMTKFNLCLINQSFSRMEIGTITFTMSAYDVLNIVCWRDSTGSLLQSSKPIAVLSGSIAVPLPINANPNHVVEMLPPTKDYGTLWVVQAPIGTDYISMYRVIFHENNTFLFFEDSTEIYSPGDYKDIEIQPSDDQQFCVSTNKSALVVLINMGKNDNSSINHYQGEAYMSIIPPDIKYGNYYVVPHSVITNSTERLAFIVYNEYIDLLVPQLNEYESTEYCDGVFETSIVELPNSSQIDSVVYHSEQPFAILMYGYGVKLGYGFPAGYNFTDTSGEEECLNSLCSDNGWCIDTSLSFCCYYPEGLYSGLFCETEISVTTTNSSYTTGGSTTKSLSPNETTTSETHSTTIEDTTTESSSSDETTISETHSTTIEDTTTESSSSDESTTTETYSTTFEKTTTEPSDESTIAETHSTRIEDTTTDFKMTSGPTTTINDSTTTNISISTNTTGNTVTTPATTTEVTSNTTGTNSHLTTTPFPKFTKNLATTFSPISAIRRIYFLCGCPCVNRQNATEMLLIHEAEQKKNILSKSNLSKTQRQKKSAENITYLEQNLGVTAVSIMTSICFIIVFLDLLKLLRWIQGHIFKRKQLLEDSKNRSRRSQNQTGHVTQT